MNTTGDIFIHPSAIVDDGAQIGQGTRIWHFCHVMPHAVIGSHCVLGQNVFVADRVRIGNGVKVQNNVSLYEGVLLEDHVFVGPSAVFTNVINPRSFIERKHEYRTTQVKEGATIGANATILCGITIGRFAFVGAGSVVTKSLPDYALVTGNPAVQSGWMSEAGCKLEFDEEGRAVCPHNGANYRLNDNMVSKI
jgi:UDP-2-acetamido-3-amino-2,3-dideoxy-glucuronate N-acetyltransferase